MEQLLRIGVITKPHGLKGQVKVYPTTDSLNRFKEVKRVVLCMQNKTIETEIQSAGFFKNLAIVKFACFNCVEEVQNLHGTDIYIHREDAQPLEEGEYYIADLLGCVVFDEDGKTLGSIKDVLQTGANDVYVVETKGSGNKKGELLLPVIPQCIKNVDIEKGKVLVHVMEGLI